MNKANKIFDENDFENIDQYRACSMAISLIRRGKRIEKQ
jgi:hypothetical protein